MVEGSNEYYFYRSLVLSTVYYLDLILHTAFIYRHAPFRHGLRNRIVPIKYQRNALKCHALGLRITEICRHSVEDEHDYEDDIVSPSDCVKRDWVHESVEEDCNDRRVPSDGISSRSQGKAPTFGGI